MLVELDMLLLDILSFQELWYRATFIPLKFYFYFLRQLWKANITTMNGLLHLILIRGAGAFRSTST